MSVLTDLKKRGVRDVFFVVCDGLNGLPEVVASSWPQSIVPDLHCPPGSAAPPT
jgi:putative transposase